MKWFQHLTDSHGNGKMRQILRKHGLEGYAFCWICRELVGKEGENYRLRAEKDWKMTLKEVTKLEDKVIDEYLGYLAEIKAINPKSLQIGDLHIPKMREYSDNWTKKLQRSSVVDTEKVSTDKITLDKITLHYITTKGFDQKLLNKEDWRRYYSAASRLFSKAGSLEQAICCIDYMSNQDYTWTLETAVKKYPEYQIEGKGDVINQMEKELEQEGSGKVN